MGVRITNIIWYLVLSSIFLLVGLYTFVIYKNKDYIPFENQEFQFSVEHPKDWKIITASLNKDYYQFIFTSANQTYKEYDNGEITDGYFEIDVTPTNYWLDMEENRQKIYKTAQELLETMHKEQSLPGFIPKIPGPPVFLRIPKHYSVNNMVEVQSVKT